MGKKMDLHAYDLEKLQEMSAKEVLTTPVVFRLTQEEDDFVEAVKDVTGQNKGEIIRNMFRLGRSVLQKTPA